MEGKTREEILCSFIYVCDVPKNKENLILKKKDNPTVVQLTRQGMDLSEDTFV